MDCLPTLGDWSPNTRWEFVKAHLSALRWHLESLETALQQGAPVLMAERPHLQELCQRGVEAHTLLELLAELPEEQLQDLA